MSTVPTRDSSTTPPPVPPATTRPFCQRCGAVVDMPYTRQSIRCRPCHQEVQVQRKPKFIDGHRFCVRCSQQIPSSSRYAKCDPCRLAGDRDPLPASPIGTPGSRTPTRLCRTCTTLLPSYQGFARCRPCRNASQAVREESATRAARVDSPSLFNSATPNFQATAVPLRPLLPKPRS